MESQLLTPRRIWAKARNTMWVGRNPLTTYPWEIVLPSCGNAAISTSGCKAGISKETLQKFICYFQLSGK